MSPRPRTLADQHGTRACYYRKPDPCRCDECKEANAAYQESRRRAEGYQWMPTIAAAAQRREGRLRKGTA